MHIEIEQEEQNTSEKYVKGMVIVMEFCKGKLNTVTCSSFFCNLTVLVKRFSFT